MEMNKTMARNDRDYACQRVQPSLRVSALLGLSLARGALMLVAARPWYWSRPLSGRARHAASPAGEIGVRADIWGLRTRAPVLKKACITG